MNREVTATLPDGSARRICVGTPVGAVVGGDDVLAAMIDYLTVDLDAPLVRDARVTPLRYGHSEANEVYRRTLTFLLAAAARRALPGVRLVIGHSLGGGYYYDLEAAAPADPAAAAGALAAEMRRLVEADLPIRKEFLSTAEASRRFEEAGREDKVLLLRRHFAHDIEVHSVDGYFDTTFGPLAPRTGLVPRFEIVAYPPGIVLRFPHKRDVNRMSAPADQTRLFGVYHESKMWSKVLGIENVGRLNEIVATRGFAETVQVAEALHEKRIAEIADRIASRRGTPPIVLVAGPSSSGKTTFAKRLALHLRVNGLRPVALSLDDYFVDRERTPRDEKGDYDFEALETVDVPYLNDQLTALLAGEEVLLPRYDFKSGRRSDETRPLRLEADEILILEGIHGLNDALTPRIPPDRKFKIYVSALTQLTIDDLHRIPTTETRLLRRIVRDRRYRGYPALETIRRWPSVRRGEDRHIFPFQESADAMFNTALLYELAVLKPYARRALEEVPPGEPEFAEARRMLDFLALFVEAPTDPVPPTSILREFIGGSSFHY